MKFLKYEIQVDADDVIEVILDKQANVLLLDDINFLHYKHGDKFTYRGGLVEKSPFRIQPPHSGHWNVVIDLGGYSGAVNASVKILKN